MGSTIFLLYIQQHKESANIGSGDSGHDDWVWITIRLVVPDLIQISGLNDMTLTQDNLEATQEFCVWRLGGQKFSIEASGKHNDGWYFRLFNDSAEHIYYRMFSGRIGGNDKRIWPNVSGYVNTKEDWNADCTSFGDNINGDTNMSLKIEIPKRNIDGKPSGRYQDTMTLTVSPVD